MNKKIYSAQKKTLYFLTFILTLVSFYSPLVYTMDCMDNFDDSDYELFEPAETDPYIDDPATKSFVKRTTFKNGNDDCSAQSIISGLVNVGVTDLLQKELYCRTNPLNKRSILDEPFLFLHMLHPQHTLTWGATAFWNQTSKKALSPQGTSIDNYLNIKSKAILKIIDEMEKIDYFLDIDLTRALNLFSTTHIQERRLGGAIQALWQQPTFALRFVLPLYYLERNFNINSQELDELSVIFGETSEGEQERFKKEHLISDKFGFGDLRVEISSIPVEHASYMLKTGFFTTLPTAWTLIKDIKGSSFKTSKLRPQLDLIDLCKNPSLDALSDFVFQALDQLSANLIDTDLGNQRHIGLGFFAQSHATLSSLIKQPWTERFSLQTRYSVEYLVPHYETRFYTIASNAQEFSRFEKYKEEGAVPPEVAQEDLRFLEKKIVDWVYPYAYTTRVYPGVVFGANGKIDYAGNRAGCFLGADFWLKGKEHFSRLCNTIGTSTASEFYTVAPTLRVKKAQLPLAYQLKAFGGLTYRLTTKHQEFILSLHADKTCTQTGIGKDFNVALQFEISF